MSIISVNREVCAAGLLPAHSHNDPHACFVLDGAMLDRQWQERNVAAGAGELMVYPGGAHHEIEVGAEGLACLIIEWGGNSQFKLQRSVCSNPVRQKIKALADSMCTDNPARRVLSTNEIVSSIGLAINDCCVESAPGWLHEVRDAIEKSEEEPSVSRLARHAGVHRATLTRRFRDAFGLSPEQYKMLLKLECAADLLKSGARLASAAHGAGFSDQPHLNRVWRRYLGATPHRWLRENATIVQDFSPGARSD